jgi:hypothetical protein
MIVNQTGLGSRYRYCTHNVYSQLELKDTYFTFVLQVDSAEVGKLMSIPKTSLSERMACMALRATVIGLGVYACYRVVKIPVSIVKTKFF